MMKRVLVLGSTGSVGQQTLDVLRGLRDSFDVVGLSGNSNSAALVEQAREFRPSAVAVACDVPEQTVSSDLARLKIDLLSGPDSLVELIRRFEPQIVVQAVSGAAGLPSSIATIEQGARLALANKESLVMAGHLLMPLAAEKGAEIIPVDSEHSAIFQCLQGCPDRSTRRVFLTASGGPFVDTPIEELRKVTPAEASQHPTWDMGGKITIDSATMMNKALEIVEAHWLFDLDPSNIEVVVHRQSIVHSMVEFADGSILAQMGIPDMRVPIRYALTYPDRPALSKDFFDFDRWSKLTFEPPDRNRFGALDLGFEAARRGGAHGAVLNAANEEAVDLFLKGLIPFDEIFNRVSLVLDKTKDIQSPTLEQILKADQWAREELARCY